MAKTRVGVLLKEKVGKSSGNQSADLLTLAQKYQVFCKKLRSLVVALEQHAGAMNQIQATRLQVAWNFANMTKGTPLFEAVGVMPSADRPSDTVCSYSSVHDNLGAKEKSYGEKYKQFVIDYVVEWEKAVTTRINEGLKKSEELRRDLDHYQKKVESMRLNVNQSMAKGKNVKGDQQEKLKRNEEKLLSAKQNYNNLAVDLCILMEEVTERSWRDLHPVLIKCAQFDSTLSLDESKVLAELNQVVKNLKNVATANGISPQPRLKDLVTLKPELLSTRPGGVQGMLMLENGSTTGSSTSPSSGSSGIMGSNATSMNGITPSGYLNQAVPAGSLAPSGLGGFPVQINDSSYISPNSMPSPASSNSGMDPYAKYEPPSSLNMMTISQNSASPPNLDDVYGTSGPLSSRSVSSSTVSLPTMGNYQKSSSFHETNSTYNNGGYSSYGASGPPLPPAMPPAMPPPPPPSFGMVPTAPPSYGMAPPPLPGVGGHLHPSLSTGHARINNEYGSPAASSYNNYGPTSQPPIVNNTAYRSY